MTPLIPPIGIVSDVAYQHLLMGALYLARSLPMGLKKASPKLRLF
ncbi:MAG: hypothetical protein V3R49_06870 [Gammaproteobacteria bacterium]